MEHLCFWIMFQQALQKQLFASLLQNNYTEKLHKIPGKTCTLDSVILKLQAYRFILEYLWIVNFYTLRLLFRLDLKH